MPLDDLPVPDPIPAEQRGGGRAAGSVNAKNPFADLPADEHAPLRRHPTPKQPQQEGNRKSMARTRLQMLRDMEQAGNTDC